MFYSFEGVIPQRIYDIVDECEEVNEICNILFNAFKVSRYGVFIKNSNIECIFKDMINKIIIEKDQDIVDTIVNETFKNIDSLTGLKEKIFDNVKCFTSKLLPFHCLEVTETCGRFNTPEYVELFNGFMFIIGSDLKKATSFGVFSIEKEEELDEEDEEDEDAFDPYETLVSILESAKYNYNNF